MQEQFSMGNKARKIIDKLCTLGVISSKNGNKPREVLSESPEDIPDEVMEILHSSSVSDSMIADAFARRNSV